MTENAPAATLTTTDATASGPTTPRKGPPQVQATADTTVQEQATQERSQRVGVDLHKLGCTLPVFSCLLCSFGDDIPGMEGLGTDITVICPWEAFSHLELHELAQFGII
ncbi:hypothetical protein lerEdw1_003892 [Lerista edwardsae]|nr:hypothetical protein lerEdw1_003892 [Lerista edwardsae]